MNIETLIPWGGLTEINGRAVRIGQPDSVFWAAWKVDKEALKAQGVSVFKKLDQFICYWWQDVQAAEAGPDIDAEADKVMLPEAIAAKLRAWQLPLVKLQTYGLRHWGVFLNASGLGSGKTYQSLATAKIVGRRVVAVCRKSAIPAWQEVAKYFGYDRNTFMAVNREALRTGKTGLGRWEDQGFKWTLPLQFMLIYDEVHNDCFVGDTLIQTDCGPIKISDFVDRKMTHKVLAFDFSVGMYKWSNVKTWYKSNSRRLVKIRHDQGEITCTSDHKIWVQNICTWKEAGSISEGDMLVLQKKSMASVQSLFLEKKWNSPKILQQVLPGEMDVQIRKFSITTKRQANVSSLLPGMQSRNRNSHSETSVLLNGVLHEMEQQMSRKERGVTQGGEKDKRNYQGETKAVGQEKNAGKQSNEEPRNARKSNAETNRTNISGAWRKWKNNNSPGNAFKGNWIANGSLNKISASKGKVPMPSEMLQSGLGGFKFQNSHRSGRKDSPHETMEVFRPEENGDSQLSRVVSVEVLEPRNSGQCGIDSSKGESVYCVEVETHHNFIANGILVHNCGINTQNGQMLIAAVEQQIPLIMLSGTAADEPLKMRALGYALGLHNLKGFYAWLFRNGVTKGNYGFEFTCGLPWSVRSGVGGEQKWRAAQQQVMARIHTKLKSEGRIVRIATKDIPGFPQVSVTPVALDFETPEIQQAYDEMASELRDLRNKSGKRDQSELEIIVRARQRIELLKVPGFVGQVEEALAEGYSIAVFFNFKASVKALGERLCAKGIRFGVFTGDNPKTREIDRTDFQANRLRVLALNLAAGSESINLHDVTGVYPVKSLISPSFNPVHLAQAIGRTGRDGSLSPALVEIVFAANTVEENAYHACQRRIERYGVFNGDFTVEDLTAGLTI